MMRLVAPFMGLALGAEVEVTPVQKVIQLLEDMLAKGKSEKHEEQVQFAAYKQFCMDTEDEKTQLIKDANMKMESLAAAIQKFEAKAAKLSEEITAHEADVATYEGDEKAATSVREIEQTDYDATHKDFSESVDAIGRAIAVLKKQSHDRTQKKEVKEFLLQVSKLARVPKANKRSIDLFLQDSQSPSGLDVKAPEANAYEFQSGGVIEMLEKLEDKFTMERTTLEKEEMNSKQAYKMLMADLKAQITTSNEAIATKKTARAKAAQSSAEAKGDLADTTATRDDDQAYLDDLVATCKTKSSNFDSRQQLRTEELEAINKAIEIISSSSLQGNADKHLAKDAEVDAGASSSYRSTSFMQLAAEKPTAQAMQSRAAALLSDRATKINSHILSALAIRVAADPFKKVRGMIQDLITKLMEEANSETEHKGWCDTELGVNELTRKEKTAAVEQLSAEQDRLTSHIAKLTEELSDLSTALTELDAAVTKATEIRLKEKSTNAQTVADAKEAQVAVANALNVLKEFYAKAGQATALVQEPADAPEIFDAPYKGMQSENGGIVGMLEVIESDFARLETETETAEAEAQAQYDKFMTDSKVSKAQMTKDVEHKTATKAKDTEALSNANDDFESTQKELNAALEYYEKLKPSCVNAGVSYEDRVKRREEEIESLQEALKILNGEELA